MTTLYVVLAALLLLGFAIWLIRRGAKREGRLEANTDALEASHDHAKKAQRIDEDVARLNDPQLDERLRNDGRK